jgi:hypothetical protein
MGIILIAPSKIVVITKPKVSVKHGILTYFQSDD